MGENTSILIFRGGGGYFVKNVWFFILIFPDIQKFGGDEKYRPPIVIEYVLRGPKSSQTFVISYRFKNSSSFLILKNFGFYGFWKLLTISFF